MALSLTMMADDFSAMRTDLPATVELYYAHGNHVSVTGIVGNMGETDGLELAGVAPGTSIEVFLKYSDLATIPRAGEHAAWNGRRFQIGEVELSPDLVTVRLGCNGVDE